MWSSGAVLSAPSLYFCAPNSLIPILPQVYLSCNVFHHSTKGLSCNLYHDRTNLSALRDKIHWQKVVHDRGTMAEATSILAFWLDFLHDYRLGVAQYARLGGLVNPWTFAGLPSGCDAHRRHVHGSDDYQWTGRVGAVRTRSLLLPR